MPREINRLRKAMQTAAAESGKVAKRHGIDSEPHKQMYALYERARDAYEAACAAAGETPYATYSED